MSEFDFISHCLFHLWWWYYSPFQKNCNKLTHKLYKLQSPMLP
jgi:hypothetical protein